MLNQLPIDIQDLIVRQLGGQDIANLSCTNKYFYTLLDPIRSILEIIPNSWPILDLNFGDMEYFSSCLDQLKHLKRCRFRFRHIQVSAVEFVYLSCFLPPTITMNLDFCNEPIAQIDHDELPFADYSKITTLEVSAECKGMQEIFQYLRKMKKLETIVVNSGDKLDKFVDWKSLFENIPLSPAKYLEVHSNNACLDSFPKLCTQLQDSNLQSILFNQCRFNDTHLAALSRVLPNCNLRELTLEMCDITDSGILALASVLKQSNLTRLALQDFKITTCGLQALSSGLHGSSIKSLNVYSKDIACGDWYILYECLENTLLESIGIFTLDDRAVKVLARTIPKSNLTHFVIPVNTPNIGDLLMATANSKILGIQICIQDNPIETTSMVKQYLRHITADTLCIDYYGNRYPTACPLFTELNLSSIRHFTLSNVILDHQSTKQISKHLASTKLASMTIACTNINDELICILASGVRCSELQYMDFSCNECLTANGIVSFVNLAKKSKLNKVDFRLIVKYDDVPAVKKEIQSVLGSLPLNVCL
ncbi:hypothetical protein HDV01_002962 [Terramyces sp. JEL0728]|nr:hypothetical protein HDV01_002962 [Terramyces sp. JEL0728]